MRCTLRTDQFAIYDGVLSEDQLDELMQFVLDQPFIPVHMNKWSKVWSLTDGSPYITRSFFSKENKLLQNGSENGNDEMEEDPFDIYPTGDTIDDVFSAINSLKKEIEPLVGRENSDWDRFSAAAFVYPQNAGLSWHTDQGNYTGAFTFYLPQQWKPEWGGELFVEAQLSGNSQASTSSMSKDNGSNTEEASSSEVKQSLGYFISPIPNRLVIIKGGTPHKINRVAPASGDRARYSISGFFNRPKLENQQTGNCITADTFVERLPTRYVARLHKNQASIIARDFGYAVAGQEYFELFRYISKSESRIRPIDLPGNFSLEEKVAIVKDLVESDVLGEYLPKV